MGKKEGKIEKALDKRIKAIGGKTRKTVYVARSGCPDRRAMLPQAYREHVYDRLPEELRNRMWPQNPWVECKSETGELEDSQAREFPRMTELGELVLVIDSVLKIDWYFPLELPA